MIEAFVLTSVIAEAEEHSTVSPVLGIINSNYQTETTTHPKVPILAYLELILKYIYTILPCMRSFP